MSETQTFFDALHGSKPEGSQILVWTLTDRRSIFCPDVPAALKAVESVRGSAQGVYAGVAVRDKAYGEYRRGKSEDATGIAGVWADFDVAGPGHQKKNLPPTQAAILDLIDRFGVPPSMSVNTGGGLHAYWLFEDFWTFQGPEDRDRAATIVRRWNNTMRLLAKSRGWDVDSTFDLSRVLRVPGTTNRKVEGRHLPVHFIQEPGDRRYSVADLEARLIDDDRNAPQKRGGSVYSGVTIGDLKLDPEATIDGVMLTALMDNDPRFKAIWEHKRRDMQDQSQSSYDLALANYAVSQLEWTDQQIVDLIICNRRRHGKDLKLRHKYYLDTIYKARQRERKEEAIRELDEARTESTLGSGSSDEEAEVSDTEPESSDPKVAETDVPDPNAKRRKKLLLAVSDLFEVDILGISKYIPGEPSYTLHTSLGDIELGDVGGLITQDVFRRKVAAIAGKFLPRFKQTQWDTIAQNLLDICVEVYTGDESSETGMMEAWIGLYIRSRSYRGFYSSCDKRPPSEHGDQLYEFGSPYTGGDGRLRIFIPDLRDWLWKTYQERIEPRAFGKRLRNIGAEPENVKVKVGDGSNKRTSKDVWIMPVRFWLSSSSGLQAEEADDD